MNKKVSPFIVALPAIVIVAIFKVFPVFYSFIVAFFDFDPKLGIGGSEAIGLNNFVDFIGSYYFKRVMRNTLVMTFIPVLLTCLVSFMATLCITRLPNKWFRYAALSILAIPAFITVPVLCGAATGLSHSDSSIAVFMHRIGKPEGANILTKPSLYPVIYSVVETLRYILPYSSRCFDCRH